MDLSDLFPRQVTTRDLKVLEKRLVEKSRSARNRRVDINKRINELEEQLARMTQTILCIRHSTRFSHFLVLVTKNSLTRSA